MKRGNYKQGLLFLSPAGRPSFLMSISESPTLGWQGPSSSVTGGPQTSDLVETVLEGNPLDPVKIQSGWYWKCKMLLLSKSVVELV